MKNVKIISLKFQKCPSLKLIDISNFNFENVYVESMLAVIQMN